MRFYRPLVKIKAITFDLDDTLYDNGPVIRQAEQALAAHIKERYPKAASLARDEWRAIQRDLIAKEARLSSDMGQLRLLTLRAALKYDVQENELLEQAAQQCFDCFYGARSQLQLDQEVRDTLAEIARRCPLIGITNGNVDSERIGIASYFKAIFHASLERPMKPHRHMFDEATEHLGVPAENILHVGDNLIKDVQGAIGAGLQAGWFACNRPMLMNIENVTVLPHVELRSLTDLLKLVD